MHEGGGFFMMKIHFVSIVSFFLATTSFAFTFDRDVPKDLQNQITQDLAFVGTLQSNTQSDLHKEIFGELSGASYNKFFTSRVTAIGLNGCGNGNAVACV